MLTNLANYNTNNFIKLLNIVFSRSKNYHYYIFLNTQTSIEYWISAIHQYCPKLFFLLLYVSYVHCMYDLPFPCYYLWNWPSEYEWKKFWSKSYTFFQCILYVFCGIVAFIVISFLFFFLFQLYLVFVMDKLVKCHWKDTQIRSLIIC